MAAHLALDDDLIKEAHHLGGQRTKREVLTQALRCAKGAALNARQPSLVNELPVLVREGCAAQADAKAADAAWAKVGDRVAVASDVWTAPETPASP